MATCLRRSTGLGSWHMLLLMLVLSAPFTATRAQPDSTLPHVPRGEQQATASVDATAASVEQNVAGLAGVGAPAVRELSPGDAREDLTVFFSIGIVIDVLLLTLFAVWAVGQWRKPRK